MDFGEERMMADDTWIEVRYLCARGGSGTLRLWLSELPEMVHRWFVSDDPHLIIDIIRL